MNWMFMLKDPNFWIATGASIILTIIMIILLSPKKKPVKKRTKIIDFQPAFDKDGNMVYDIHYIHPRYKYRTCGSLEWNDDSPNLDDQVEILLSNIWIHPQDKKVPTRTTVTVGVRVQAPESHQILAVAFKWKEDGCQAQLTRFVCEPNKKGVWESTMSSDPERPSCRMMFSIVAIVLVGENIYCYNRPERWSYVS